MPMMATGSYAAWVSFGLPFVSCSETPLGSVSSPFVVWPLVIGTSGLVIAKQFRSCPGGSFRFEPQPDGLRCNLRTGTGWLYVFLELARCYSCMS